MGKKIKIYVSILFLSIAFLLTGIALAESMDCYMIGCIGPGSCAVGGGDIIYPCTILCHDGTPTPLCYEKP